MNLRPEDITGENYLNIAYMGTPPAELDAEAEADLPEEFQIWNVE